MTEKRFTFNSDTVATNLKTPIVYDNKIMNIGEVLEKLNELSDENEQLKEDYDYLEKRFKEEEWHYEYIDEDRDVWHYKCTQLEKENEQLKKELQKIYEIATINKVKDIVENVYDDLLYETSEKSNYARIKVLKCLEDIDNLRDDLE